MSSTDMGDPVLIYLDIRSEAERKAACAHARCIILRRMNTPAENVAVIPLQRIGTRQGMIAGKRQRVLDDRDRVIGDGELDDAGFGSTQQNAIIEISGEAFDQPRVDGEARLDAADDLLRTRQCGK